MSFSNVDNIVLASSLPTDKIVGLYTGSFSAASGPYLSSSGSFNYMPYKAIPHSFGQPVFVKLLWSTDGTTYFDANTGNSVSNSAIAYSTSTNIIVTTSRSTGTLYYKVIAFWIDDYDASNPSVSAFSGTANPVFYDTRLDYQKIYDYGQFTVDGTSMHTETINHSLGFRPNVRVYNEMLPGEIWPANTGGSKNPWLYDFNMIQAFPVSNTTNVEITTTGGMGSQTDAKVFYIIYYDE